MMTDNIPLPRLLPSSAWDERRIIPVTVSITQKITPLSYAAIQLAPGETIPARGYIELYTCMGSAGIFRVRSPQETYGEDCSTAELEHAVVEVGDYLVRAKYDEMMAASTAMQTVFSYYTAAGGSRWQLGDVSALGSGQIALQVNYDKVLSAMLAILDQKPDCMMAFNFSTSPWTISVVAKGTTVQAEGRLSRNVNDVTISYDDTELCTRVWYEKETTTDTVTVEDGFPVFSAATYYAPGEYVSHENKLYTLPNGHEVNVTWANTTKTAITNYPASEWSYVQDSAAINAYGLIERSVSTGSDYSASEALYVATQYLNAHKSPRISIKTSAEELSSETGESFDAFDIGKLCRLALVDYGVTVERNITELTFNNVYGNLRDITVCLADDEDMIVNFLHDLDSKGGSGGGGGGKKKQDDQFKEYYTELYQDDYRIKLAAYQADKARGILKAAGIDIDASGVAIYATDKETHLQSKINAEADRISLVVSGYGEEAAIRPAEIVLSINADHGSEILIAADTIDIQGLVDALDAYAVTTESLNVLNTTVFDGEVTFNDGAAFSNTTVTGISTLIADDATFDSMTFDSYGVSWQQVSIKHITSTSKNQYFAYTSSSSGTSITGAKYGMLVTGETTTTLHYLGY